MMHMVVSELSWQPFNSWLVAKYYENNRNFRKLPFKPF